MDQSNNQINQPAKQITNQPVTPTQPAATPPSKPPTAAAPTPPPMELKKKSNLPMMLTIILLLIIILAAAAFFLPSQSTNQAPANQQPRNQNISEPTAIPTPTTGEAQNVDQVQMEAETDSEADFKDLDTDLRSLEGTTTP